MTRPHHTTMLHWILGALGVRTFGEPGSRPRRDVLRVELIAATAGDKIQFNEILMLGGDSLVLGSPLVKGAAVQAEVIDNIKADKVITFHKRRRKHSSQRTRGHRQKLTLVRVTEIVAEPVLPAAGSTPTGPSGPTRPKGPSGPAGPSTPVDPPGCSAGSLCKPPAWHARPTQLLLRPTRSAICA